MLQGQYHQRAPVHARRAAAPVATVDAEVRTSIPTDQQGQFESFALTAAAIKALELVITVDTSVAHLAGALGVPTWLLLSWDPDFRWGLKGSKTIWYQNMRIFRQPAFRDWGSVIDTVTAELERYPWRSET